MSQRSAASPLTTIILVGMVGCGGPEDTNPDDDDVILGLETLCDLDGFGPELEVAYVADAEQDVVHVVNPRRCEAFKSIPVGDEPTVMNVSTSGQWIFVGNTGDGTMSIIDTEVDELYETIELDVKPQRMRFDTAHRMIWIMGEGKVQFFDTFEWELAGTVDLGPGTHEMSMTSTAEDKTYVACQEENRILAYDAKTFSQIASIEVSGSPVAVDYAPGTAQTYACVGGEEPELAVISADGVLADVVSANVELASECSFVEFNGRYGIAVHPDEGMLTIVDTQSVDIARSIDVGGRPDEVIFRGDVALVSNSGSGEVHVIDLDSLDLVKTVSIGNPVSAEDEVRRENRRSVYMDWAYFVNPNDGTVTVFDVVNQDVRGTITVGGRPVSVIIGGPVGGTCC